MGIHIPLRKNAGETVMEGSGADKTESSPPAASGNPPGIDRLFTVAYEELKRLAASVSRDDRAMTLSPTALVNEAWVKLSQSAPLQFESHLHFRSVAARAMRQVLVEAARRRSAARRGADPAFVTFDDDIGRPAAGANDIVALNEALDELAHLSPRQAEMIEARFFGGFDTAEIATLLGISEATVLRDWRAARAWLARELRS
jgi:RNA polymerase sigma factor (TIGR02999 family)